MGILAAGEDHDRKGGDGEREREVVLERGVVVETGAVVEARWVGEGTVVEVGAKVGRGCIVGKVSFFFSTFFSPLYISGLETTVIFLEKGGAGGNKWAWESSFLSIYLSVCLGGSFLFGYLEAGDWREMFSRLFRISL